MCMCEFDTVSLSNYCEITIALYSNKLYSNTRGLLAINKKANITRIELILRVLYGENLYLELIFVFIFYFHYFLLVPLSSL